MPTNLVTNMKWTNDLKDTNQQCSHEKKQIIKQIYIFKNDSIINNFPKINIQDLDDSMGEINQIFKDEITPIPYNLFQRIEAVNITFKS